MHFTYLAVKIEFYILVIKNGVLRTSNEEFFPVKVYVGINFVLAPMWGTIT